MTIFFQIGTESYFIVTDFKFSGWFSVNVGPVMANYIEWYMSQHPIEFATHLSIACEISGEGGEVLWEKNVPLRNC